MGFHVGEKFGDYSITAVLSGDGLDRVYKVEHSITKRTEAMKILSAESASESHIKRFEREMRALARLNHPNIAGLHNAITVENQLALFMEYVEGQTLESMFSAGRLEHHTGIALIRQILTALGYAHQQGVVHRDVTPANVTVTANGQIKLTDFGLSKAYGDSLLTSCGEVLGSLPYLAPEQLKGVTQPDRRSDLFSVGAILYEHLTGQKPFGADRRLAPVLTDSEGEPRPPSELEPRLSPQWDEVVRRALARDPARRYQSAEEFLDAIAHLEQRTAAGLPLPQLRSLGVGIALLAGVALAMFASPELGRFHRIAPLAVPWQKLHIAPPEFATAKTPSSVLDAMNAAPVAPKPSEIRHVQHFARPAPARVLAPPPVIQPSSAAAIVPPPPIVSAPPPIAAPATEKPAGTPSSQAPLSPSAPQDAPPHKRGFWRKLNPFKKKSPQPDDSN